MEAEAQAFTKRLSFGSLAAHLNTNQSVEVEDVIKALKNPSIDNFQKAVELLHHDYEQRFAAIVETAKDQSASVGDADLRRLKRQFSSLKNTFLHYEVKEEFLAALADGLPNGTEEVQLAQFEEEVARNVDALRALKANNEEAQIAIGELIEEIVKSLQGLDQRREEAAAILGRLHRDLQRHEAELAEVPLPPALPQGLNETECHDDLAAAAVETRELEAQIAQQAAEAAELEAAIAAERQELELARAQVADLQAQRDAQATADTPQPPQNRYADVVQWADQATSLIASLGGITLSAEASSSHEAVLVVTTTYPTGPVMGGSLGPCASAQHELRLSLDPGSGAVCDVAISPADVPVEDLVVGQSDDICTLERVVREVRSRVATHLHCKSLFQSAAAKFPAITTVGEGYQTANCPLPEGGSVQLTLRRSWPLGDDCVEVVAVQGTADAEKARKVEGWVMEGRGLLQGIEAVVREM